MKLQLYICMKIYMNIYSYMNSYNEEFYSESGETLEQVAHRGDSCRIPGNIQVQFGQDSEETDLVEDVLTHYRKRLDQMTSNPNYSMILEGKGVDVISDFRLPWVWCELLKVWNLVRAETLWLSFTADVFHPHISLKEEMCYLREAEVVKNGCRWSLNTVVFIHWGSLREEKAFSQGTRSSSCTGSCLQW